MLRRTFPICRSAQFGRRRIAAGALVRPAWAAANELRLFAMTFAGGLLFMSVYLA